MKWNLFKSFWDFISEAGNSPDNSEPTNNAIRLTNQIMVISTIIALFSGLPYLIAKDYFRYLPLVGYALSAALCIYFNMKYKSNIARFIILLAIQLLVFYYNTYLTFSGGLYLYYFPLIVALGFMFDIKNDLKIIIFHLVLIAVALFTSSELISRNILVSKTLSDYNVELMLKENFIISLALVLFFSYLISVIYRKHNQFLEEKVVQKTKDETKALILLKEKEVLLAEVHHRVKNNLSIINSLVNLEMNKLDYSDKSYSILMDLSSRIRTMALIHNKLYNQKQISQLDFSGYLTDLCEELKSTFILNKKIDISYDIESIILNMDTAIPLGLITNEIITNCFKHAFKEVEEGHVKISFKRKGNNLRLIIKDNGKGIPETFKREDCESLGLILVESLSDQLGGIFSFENVNGTEFKLELKNIY